MTTSNHGNPLPAPLAPSSAPAPEHVPESEQNQDKTAKSLPAVASQLESRASRDALLREFWHAVCEWERHNMRNNKHTPDELRRAYERAQAASDAVESRLTDLTRDAERLDWLEAVRPRVGLGEEREARLLSRVGDGDLLASEPTLRAAIDAAMDSAPWDDGGGRPASPDPLAQWRPEAAAVDPSRSYPDGAAALTPTLAAPTGAAAPTPTLITDDEIRALFAHREMTDADIDAVREFAAVCARAASPAGRAPQWSDEYWQLDQAVMDAEELPRPEAQIAVLRSIRDRWDALSAAGRAPAEDVRGETCPRCGAETRRHENDATMRYCSRCDISWAERPHAAGRAPARAGTTPELIEAWQALAEYRAENARLRAEVSRLSADRAGGA